MREHERRFHNRKRETKHERKFECEVCKLKVTERSTLRKHMKKLHNIILPFCRVMNTGDHACSMCERKFRDKTALKNHMISQHHVAPKKERHVSYRGNMNKGRPQTEGFKAKFVCTECGKGLSRFLPFRNHMISVHEWSIEKFNESMNVVTEGRRNEWTSLQKTD